MKRICVYCGSSAGRVPEYAELAKSLAHELTSRGIGLVYGGSSVGLMSEVANTVLAAGGEVIGIIPQALVDKEVAHHGLTELKVVGSMHERKAMMAELSDGFIALPGGLGTLEELFEILTWSQLGMHKKPCGLLSVNNYYDHLIAFLDHATEEQFVKKMHRDMLLVDNNPNNLLNAMQDYCPPQIGKWIGRNEA